MHIKELLQKVPRARFLPPEVRRYWLMDRPLALSHGATNSQPSTVAAMLRLLDAQPGQKVLDVGSGSGWSTALLAEIVGPNGRVIGVERLEPLIATAREALGKDWPWAEIRRDVPGQLGAPDDGPYDRILVSAMAEDVPQALIDQLADGGILVVPAAGVMHRVVKTGDDIQITEHGRYTFVPLIQDNL